MSSTVHHLITEVTPRRMDPVPAAPPPPHQHDTVSDGPDGDTPEATGHDGVTTRKCTLRTLRVNPTRTLRLFC